MSALPADARPFDLTPVNTHDLPDTPTPDRNIAASAWKQAPTALLSLGERLGIGPDRTAFKRRVGPWLLWRAGPARGPAVYLAVDSHDSGRTCAFELDGARSGRGRGPTGTEHTRFRTWKEDLLTT